MRWRPSILLPPRRWQRVLAGVLALLVLAWFLGPQLFVPQIRSKLQGMIGGHLDARLDIGRLSYAPPFGVRARDVRLVSGTSLPGWKGQVELLRVDKLDLKLARLPFRRGPLVIQNITVTDPEVHLIRTEEGRLVGMHDFIRAGNPTGRAATQPHATTQATTAPATQPEILLEDAAEAEQEAARAKLSDMFELRHFGITGGRIVYEDRSRPDLPPVVWKGLNVGMETAPKSKGVYGYEMRADDGDLARLDSTGSFDLDALTADVGKLRLEAHTVYREDESPLPTQVQRALRDYRVQGRVTVDVEGRFDARDKWASTYRATVEVKDASGYAPQLGVALDRLSLKLSADNRTPVPAAGDGSSSPAPRAGPVHVALEGLDAASGDARLRLDKAEVLVDRAEGTWSMAQVAGRLDLGGEGGAPAGAPTADPRSRPLLAGTGARGSIDFTAAADGLLSRRPGEYFVRPEDVSLLAYPRDVSFRPPKWPAALEHIGGGGSVRKDRGSRVIALQNVALSYGGDAIEVTSARLPLPADLRDLPKQTRVEEISGTINFRRPGPRYPGGFGRVVEALRPVGPFVIGRDSWYSVTDVKPPLRIRPDLASPPALPPSRKSDYFFSVSTDAGSFTLTDYRIPLTNMAGDATVSNMLVDVRRLRADVLGGKLTAAVKVSPGSPTKYQGTGYLRGIDLEAVSRLFILPETEKSRLTGVGNLDAEFSVGEPHGQGEGSELSRVRAAGQFEILRGDFWTIPVLGDVAGRVATGAGSKRSLGTVGEAAGFFETADGVLVLRNAAVSSPALGLIGSGSVELEGERRLDLRIVAAPLGDWKDKMKQTGVPLLSDVAGEIVGAVQKILNTATSTLLYEFRVTGTTGHPNVATVPVPALTEPAALLFGRMVKGDKEKRLLETMGGKQTDQAP
jgi:hypothetical protein